MFQHILFKNFVLKIVVGALILIFLTLSFIPLATFAADTTGTPGAGLGAGVGTASSVTGTVRESGTCSFGGAAGDIIGVGAGFSLLACVAEGVNWVLSIAALITWAGGIMLNFAVVETIVNASAYLGSTSVTKAWELMRNLGNLMLIFGFLAVGIGTILNVGSFTIRRTLPLLIIAALLVNFSLFFTKVIVDVSNQLALFAYAQVEDITKNCNDRSDGCLSDAFMQALRLPTIYNLGTEGGQPTPDATIDVWDMILIGVMGIVLLSITGFVFLAAAFLLLMRFVALVFLMVLSPLALIALAIPGLQGQWKRWLDKLIGHAFYAPVFFFLIVVVLILIDNGNFFLIDANLTIDPGSQATDFEKTAYAQAIRNNAGGGISSARIFIQFAIIIALVVGTLIIAKMMSIEGSTRVISWGKSAKNWAQRNVQRGAGAATFGAAGWVGRNTVGRGASRVARSEGFQQLAGKSWAAEQALRATRGLAGRSYDARRVAGMGKTLGIGEGASTSYEKGLESTIKRKEEFAKTLDRKGKFEYAQRQALGVPGRWTAAGIIGRSNRVAGSKILLEREKEVKEELRKLNGEETQLEEVKAKRAAATPAGTLTAEESRRLYVDIPRERTRLDGELTSIEAAKTTIETTLGSKPSDIKKRQY